MKWLSELEKITNHLPEYIEWQRQFHYLVIRKDQGVWIGEYRASEYNILKQIIKPALVTVIEELHLFSLEAGRIKK